MVKKIELQELLDYIEKQIAVDKNTIIHIFDYGKNERVFDISIEPYGQNRIEYFKMDMPKEKPYDVVFNALKDIYPSQTKLITDKSVGYNYSVHLRICEKIWIIVDFYYERGKKWMKKVYEKNKNK